MPKKVLQCECFAEITSTNMARHKKKCRFGVRARTTPTKVCIFCGKPQTKMARHIRQSCKGDKLTEDYVFIDKKGTLIKGRGLQIREILIKLRNFDHLRVGGPNTTGKTTCLTHLLKNIPYSVVDGAGIHTISTIISKIRDAPQNLVIVDMYERPEVVLDVEGKKIITVSDIADFSYQVNFLPINKHIIGEYGEYWVR